MAHFINYLKSFEHKNNSNTNYSNITIELKLLDRVDWVEIELKLLDHHNQIQITGLSESLDYANVSEKIFITLTESEVWNAKTVNRVIIFNKFAILFR